MNYSKKDLSLFLAFAHIFLCSNILNAQLLHVTNENREACRYVGNTFPENGQAQLQLLLNEGLQKDNYVLDIGCGALVAGIPIMSFLDANHFAGIDPNKWLSDASLRVDENKKISDQKQPQFLYNSEFNGKEFNREFDYIISHSIMSHAPLWQLQLFLKMCSEVLKDGGKVIFSLRLTKASTFYGNAPETESTTTEWQYPGNTFFHEATVIAEASKYFKKVERKKSYTEIIMLTDSGAFHDWFVLTK